MVTYSNAIIQPLAMMVKTVYAFVANMAVTRFFWLQYLAACTDIALMKVFVHFQKWYIIWFFYNSRIFEAWPKKENPLHSKQYWYWIKAIITVMERHYEKEVCKETSWHCNNIKYHRGAWPFKFIKWLTPVKARNVTWLSTHYSLNL